MMERMHQDMGQASASADRDFLVGMIAHHQGALDMAEIAIQHGRDPAVRTFAENIIRAQQGEIILMRQMLATLPLGPESAGGPAADYQAAWDGFMARMHTGMDIPLTPDVDRDFMVGMIAHHQAAIDMSDLLMRHGRQPDIHSLAFHIAIDQQMEIRFMERWLARVDGRAGAGSQTALR